MCIITVSTTTLMTVESKSKDSSEVVNGLSKDIQLTAYLVKLVGFAIKGLVQLNIMFLTHNHLRTRRVLGMTHTCSAD